MAGRICGASLLFDAGKPKIGLLMNLVRLFLCCAVFAVGSTGLAVAQDDPAREYFSAYQEFQRAERLEREGRTDDAIAKFRFVATQLSQIKSQSPDWPERRSSWYASDRARSVVQSCQCCRCGTRPIG